MRIRSLIVAFSVGVLTLGVCNDPSFAAMQIRKKATKPAAPAAPAPAPAPSAPAPKPAATPSSTPAPVQVAKPVASPAKAAAPKPKATISEDSFVGTVMYVRGNQLLVELPEGAARGERYVVYSDRLKRVGRAVVLREVSEGMFMLSTTAGSGSTGDRLAKETEREAYSRVRRMNKLSAYREFLKAFPNSKYAASAAQRMFRLNIRENYPASPGTTITGKLTLNEKVSQDIPLGRAMIKLDRFVIAMTDDVGNFTIEGLPTLELPVRVKMQVRDEKFKMAEDTYLEIPASEPSKLEQDLKVNLTPTVLTGEIVDKSGEPVREAEVWTSPYTMEVLTDENGKYQISRRKRIDASGGILEGDEPLLGRDYTVYAYRKGFGAELVTLEAKNFQVNEAKAIKLERQDPFEEGVPELSVDLSANLDLMQFVVPAGSGPKFNR